MKKAEAIAAQMITLLRHIYQQVLLLIFYINRIIIITLLPQFPFHHL